MDARTKLHGLSVPLHTRGMTAARSAQAWRVEVARRMRENLDDSVDRMMGDELGRTPALGADATMTAEVRASNRANAEAVLAVLERPESALDGADVPPEALDVVRTVVRRGLDLELIYRAYRRGQSVLWNDFMACAAEVAGPDDDVVGFLTESSALLFDYIDLVIAQVIAAAQREREDIVGGALSRRIEAVRLILDGAPLDVGNASERLGHDLQQWHTALVLWSEPGSDSPGALESAALQLARSVDARPPLTIVAGVSSLWAWIGTSQVPATDALRAVEQRLPDGVRVAVGSTREGMGGFRASHVEALDVQALVDSRGGGGALSLHEDHEVALLLGGDARSAADFVQRVLGGLAEDSPVAEGLRETVRIFLAEGGNAPRVAARMFTHRNTVLQRVERASRLLGYRPEENRLSVAVALELAHHLGPRVLA
jgi:DNA-binding PucR family transcriptional regulator